MTAMIPTPEAHILTIDGGSSSIKFSMFEVGEPLSPLLEGVIDGIGHATGTLTVHGSTGTGSASSGSSSTSPETRALPA